MGETSRPFTRYITFSVIVGWTIICAKLGRNSGSWQVVYVYQRAEDWEAENGWATVLWWVSSLTHLFTLALICGDFGCFFRGWSRWFCWTRRGEGRVLKPHHACSARPLHLKSASLRGIISWRMCGLHDVVVESSEKWLVSRFRVFRWRTRWEEHSRLADFTLHRKDQCQRENSHL